jgi:RNA polymerase sigma-54 factor
MGIADSLAAKIVQNHLDKLEKRKYDQIAKIEQVAVDEVYAAVNAIQGLEPRPGRPFNEEAIRYVVPDIYVYKVGQDYVITLNEDGLPKLRVSPYYLQLLKSKDAENLPNRTYLQERLKAATWLIKSIHQRQQTIYKVTESIVKFQRGFLDFGIKKLRPLTLKDVADDISMHESTVSRVTTNKYVHTPQGVFELKFFFTTGIKTAGGDVSSSAIKEQIKTIIAAEDPQNPISDQQIVDMLKKENMDIARRTVAKYRESLGLPSSAQRKKPF